MTALKRIWRVPGGKAGLVISGIFLCLVLGADLLASSRPILARWRGEIYVLPDLFTPEAFPADHDELRRTMQPGDWYIPPLVPYGPAQSRIGGSVRALRPPSSENWLGTDRAGADVFARLVHGARASLGVGILAALLTALVGLLLGLAAGSRLRFVDSALSRFADAMLSFPPLVLLCVLQALVIHRGPWSTALVIAMAGWPHVFRLVRGEVLRTRELEYVVSARALGASPMRVTWVHLLPAALPPVLTASAFAVPAAMLLEVALSYLGAGLPPTVASWGDLLHQAGFGVSRWWLVVFPGLAIGAASAGLLLLAEAARQLLDPRPSTLRSLR